MIDPVEHLECVVQVCQETEEKVLLLNQVGCQTQFDIEKRVPLLEEVRLDGGKRVPKARQAEEELFIDWVGCLSILLAAWVVRVVLQDIARVDDDGVLFEHIDLVEQIVCILVQ